MAKAVAYYNQNILTLPLDNLLLENGYVLKKEKCSKNHLTLTNNNNDLIVITRAANNHYLYFNPNDERDRGNIYSFCKNRNIKLEKLLKAKDLSQLSHNINPSNLTQKNLEIITIFNEKQAIKENNFFSKNRLIASDILLHFPLKMDKMKNILSPTFVLEKIESINFIGINQAGYVSYLQNPLKKDKNQNAYHKPIKHLCYGAKGLEILKHPQTKKAEIKNIILSESIVDSLSLLELKGYDPKTTLICSSNGQITQKQRELLEHFSKIFKNTQIILAFDNDEKGRKFAKKCEELFQKNNMATQILQPILKDFNDDLNAYKLLNLSKNFTLKELENKIENDTSRFINDFLKKEKILNPLSFKKRLKEAIIFSKILNYLQEKIQNHIDLNKVNQSLKNFNIFIQTKKINTKEKQ
ncbi:toprim domain-containing protein [Campylobacter upsaliensis]|uniref:toprim domain-containing protein n=1 Tax=Campylobacter upsaliensis TaxID=28080 RepID=UPI001282D224|nr:toprim domain-containing protein [Campylobacter upsaliensis]EAI8054461.1 toprim domain-containing protein [Campylobacter upsaliensis]EAK0955199.1 toprim domain-containing protein [Campylobacter upsaliensis]EAK4449612.1 toprim domain-containing protein [Campylobacter upsaliensis]EBD1833911.1 toprim domain-containing protein [Campylobacter upsaliensis]MCR2095676.1 toprim domain-containing protein [Campylobacter upsaliensis]